MGDRIDWEPKPYKKPAQGLAIDLWPTTWRVFFEEGMMTWDEYAQAAPFDSRPMHLRHKPKTLPELKPLEVRRRVFPHTPE